MKSCAAGNDPYACDIPRRRALPEERRTARFLKQQMSQLTGKTGYLDPTEAYCTVTICGGSVDGIYTWYDHLHLSATRTKALSSYFRPSIRQLRRG